MQDLERQREAHVLVSLRIRSSAATRSSWPRLGASTRWGSSFIILFIAPMGRPRALNLVPACSSCHQAHHAGALTITGTGDHLEVRRSTDPSSVAMTDAHVDAIASDNPHVGASDTPHWAHPRSSTRSPFARRPKSLIGRSLLWLSFSESQHQIRRKERWHGALDCERGARVSMVGMIAPVTGPLAFSRGLFRTVVAISAHPCHRCHRVPQGPQLGAAVAHVGTSAAAGVARADDIAKTSSSRSRLSITNRGDVIRSAQPR